VLGMCFTHQRLLYERAVQRCAQASDTDRSTAPEGPARGPTKSPPGPESTGFSDLEPATVEPAGVKVRLQV
jgi:hypothetical protein